MIRVLLLCCAVAVVFAQRRVDAHLGGFRAQDEALYLWSGEQVRRLVPGLESLAADVYWLRTVQYFGDQRLFSRNRDFKLLRPLIEITVTLDPRLSIAYRYGAVFLAEPPPLGAGRPEEAIALLDRGIRATPENWWLHQDKGFYQFLFLRDARAASATLLEAAAIPGAPFWLRNMAADVLAKGRDRQTAMRMWKEIHEQSDGIIKDNALIQYLMVEALYQADQLTELVAHYRERHGANPRSLEELRNAGLLRRAPVDSTGAPFEYDPGSGTVRVSRTSRLWRPTE